MSTRERPRGPWIVGVDLQPDSAELVAVAEGWRAAFGAESILVAVLRAGAGAEEVDRAEQRLAELAAGCGDGVRFEVRTGRASDELAVAAEAYGAAVIVVGRRRLPLRHTLYTGTTVGELVAAATVPLLVVPLVGGRA